MLRLAFFGSDEIAIPALEAALAGRAPLCEIPLVVSQPDRPSGRGRELQANAIAQWARARGVAVLQPERAGAETVAALREHGCSAALVMAYGCILKRDLLDTPPLGIFNLHASLLPQFRGAAPIEGAIAAGLEETGVCLQRVAPRLDSGPVVDAERVRLAPDETRLTLREKIAAACVPLLLRTLPRIEAGDAAGTPQDEAAATFVRKISREDSGVDFSAPAREIAARVRALSPWPGVTLPWEEGVMLKIGEAVAEDPAPERTPPTPAPVPDDECTGKIACATQVRHDLPPPPDAALPGTVLGADAAGVRIATGAGVLRVLQLQRPGGRMLPAKLFLSGFPIPAGHLFPSRPMPPLCRR